jgi:hypothetical protein
LDGVGRDAGASKLLLVRMYKKRFNFKFVNSGLTLRMQNASGAVIKL